MTKDRAGLRNGLRRWDGKFEVGPLPQLSQLRHRKPHILSQHPDADRKCCNLYYIGMYISGIRHESPKLWMILSQGRRLLSLCSRPGS